MRTAGWFLTVSLSCLKFKPSNAETTFVQSTRKQNSWKTIETLSSWYSFESSRRVLSDEYPFARISVIFYFSLHQLVQVNLDMTDHCMPNFCIWRTVCLAPVRCISSIRHMYTTDFAYDGPIFLVPLSPSYPSSPVLAKLASSSIGVKC